MSIPVVRAVGFESRKVYQSQQRPSYTSWVSFFPGEKGKWYLTCEEVTRPKVPLARCSQEQLYEMCLPVGYDKSPYLMEAVILESTDDMKTWHVISRQPYRHHHSVGQFATCSPKDGSFLRFILASYSLDESVKSNEIRYESSDNGKTWNKMPPFHNPHFASHPHRLRTLRDGTLVLAVPLTPRWKAGTERPTRLAMRLDALGEMQMMLFFSHDQGKAWDGPLPIYGGQNVSETDFVEIPSGDLLFINNGLFANPGRQFVYRDGNRFTPGALEKVRFVEPGGFVPETVCLTEEGILVGCMRNSLYMWSDDLGETWWRLEGAPDLTPEMYQPWIQYLGNNRIACAGHYGADDAYGTIDQYVMVHLFKIEILQKTKDTRILVERDIDKADNRYTNAYNLILTCDDSPLSGKELEFWYVERGKPGYDAFNKHTLEERMAMGGTLIRVRTGSDGRAHIHLPHLDTIKDIHHGIQFVVRFNTDRSEPAYKPCQTCQFYFYSVS